MNKLLLYIFLIFIVSSCSVKVKDIDYAKVPGDTKELLAKVISKNKTPEWLYLKGRVSLLKDDKKTTLKINIKSRKDSLIWASIRTTFGIELFRISLTKDSAFFLNHTNKTFFVKPITQIPTFAKADISFDEIQEMITSNPRVLKKEYIFRVFENTFELTSKQAFYKVSTEFYRILNARIINAENELSYSFSNFYRVNYTNEFVFPKQFSISIRSPKHFTSAILDYSKVVFNEKQKLPFKIPISYVEME